jgi:hypothetical protein
MRRTDVSYEEWLDWTFGRAVTGDWHPQFVEREDWPDPVSDELALAYLTRLFENSEESLRYYSDRQISCGLWELGPRDAHCVYNRDVPIADRERLIGSVATFFSDYFDKRCIPKLAHLDTDHTEPLNGICYMWWEVITWGWATGDPDTERLTSKDLDVMETVLQLPNPACKESALHGLGHIVRRSGRATTIIERFLADEKNLSPDLGRYARAAATGCIQ